MKRSRPITNEDVRHLMRLFGDLRACNTAIEQGTVLIEGLRKMVGGDVAWLAECTKDADAKEAAWMPVHFQIGPTADEPVMKYIREWGRQFPFDFDMIAVAVVADTRPSFARHWQDIQRLWPTTEYTPFRDLVNTLGISDMINPCFSLRPGHVMSVNIQRIGRRAQFGPREIELMELAAAEVRWLGETGRLKCSVMNHQDKQADLAPRLRQVLQALLDGHAPKTIAVDLGLSIWTVRDHISRLYEHYGVTGRDQLAALFIK